MRSNLPLLLAHREFLRCNSPLPFAQRAVLRKKIHSYCNSNNAAPLSARENDVSIEIEKEEGYIIGGETKKNRFTRGLRSPEPGYLKQ